MDKVKDIDLFSKPQRDASGKFVKGNTSTPIDKVGRPCGFCKDKENVMKKVSLFSLWTRGKLPDGKLHMPYVQTLCDEDFLNVLPETFYDWTDDKDEHCLAEHAELIHIRKALFSRKEGMLLNRTLSANPAGSIFQLKVHYGYVETEKRILAGDAQNPIQEKLEIAMVPARRHDE